MADSNDLTGKDKDPNKEDDKKLPGAEEMQLLGKAVSFLAQGFEELKGQTKTIGEGQAKLMALVETFGKGASKEEKKEVVKDIFADVDLENMTDAQKLQLVLSRTEEVIASRVEEGLKKAGERVDQLASAFQQKNAHEAVQAMKEKNADFFEWAPEMKALLDTNPALSVAQAYVLVKNDDPKKVAEMTKKYAKKEDEVGNRRKGYGLTPTSSNTGDKGGRMSAQEAADKAFDEIMSDVLNVVNK